MACLKGVLAVEPQYVFKLAKNRRSIRRFCPEPVDPRDVFYALSTALQAPSGANMQPWRFIVVKDQGVKARLRSVCEQWEKRFHEGRGLPQWFRQWLEERGIGWEKPFLTEAPYIVAVASWRKAPYGRESTWLAIGYMLLSLEERGLAPLTYTPSNPRAAAEVLDIPGDYSLEALIPVGKPAEDKAKEPRMSLEKAVYLDKWGNELGKKYREDE
jgi:nitroreductase